MKPARSNDVRLKPTVPLSTIYLRTFNKQTSLSKPLKIHKIEIFNDFINIPFDQIHGKIDYALKLIVESLDIDRSLLHGFPEGEKTLRLSQFFVRPGIKKPTSIITCSDQPYLTKIMLSGETSHYL